MLPLLVKTVVPTSTTECYGGQERQAVTANIAVVGCIEGLCWAATKEFGCN